MRNPFRDVHNLHGLRVDQGVDYSGSGVIYSPCLAKVIVYNAHDSGWPGPHGGPGGYIAIRMLHGTKFPSYTVAETAKMIDEHYGFPLYWAENIILNSHLHVGSLVTNTTPLAVLSDAYPNLEAGFSTENGLRPLAQLYGNVPEHATELGASFNKLMVKVGAPIGTAETNVVGTLPPNWPT